MLDEWQEIEAWFVFFEDGFRVFFFAGLVLRERKLYRYDISIIWSLVAVLELKGKNDVCLQGHTPLDSAGPRRAGRTELGCRFIRGKQVKELLSPRDPALPVLNRSRRRLAR